VAGVTCLFEHIGPIRVVEVNATPASHHSSVSANGLIEKIWGRCWTNILTLPKARSPGSPLRIALTTHRQPRPPADPLACADIGCNRVRKLRD